MNNIKNGIRKINAGILKKQEKENVITFISVGSTRAQQIIIVNMALMYGQANEKTVIIDSDFGSDSLVETFGLKDKKGLSDYLNDRSIDLDSITNEISGQNTSVIAPGTLDVSETKYLIGDPRFKLLINELSLNYGKILINTPAFERIDTLSNYIFVSDGIILITDSKATSKKKVYKTIKTLRMNDATLLGYVDVKKG